MRKLGFTAGQLALAVVLFGTGLAMAGMALPTPIPPDPGLLPTPSPVPTPAPAGGFDLGSVFKIATGQLTLGQALAGVFIGAITQYGKNKVHAQNAKLIGAFATILSVVAAFLLAWSTGDLATLDVPTLATQLLEALKVLGIATLAWLIALKGAWSKPQT